MSLLLQGVQLAYCNHQYFLLSISSQFHTCALSLITTPLRFVIASMPTYFEEGMMNCIEDYTWNNKKSRIDVSFRMQVMYFILCSFHSSVYLAFTLPFSFYSSSHIVFYIFTRICIFCRPLQVPSLLSSCSELLSPTKLQARNGPSPQRYYDQ